MKRRLTFLLISLFLFSQSIFSQNYSPRYQYQKFINDARMYYAQKDYPKALDNYEQALELFGSNRIDLYNTACTASLLDDTDKANVYLRRSIENGYIDIEWLEKDIDFENLRKTKYWEENLKLIKAKFHAIEKDFAGVKDFQLSNLVPFKKDGKWGYLDKESFQVVVPPNYYSVSFGGNCITVALASDNSIRVDENGTVKIFKPRMNYPPPPPRPAFSNTPQIDSSESFKGFRVNGKGEITHVSFIYEAKEEVEFMDMDIDEDEVVDVDVDVDGKVYEDKEPIKELQKVDIFGPFKINNKWHAITLKNDKYGVIDESGNELKSLGFKFEKLSRIEEYEGDGILFRFKDSFGKYGFINSAGEVKLYDEFDNFYLNSISEHRPNYFLFFKKDLSGILDLSSLEWIIPLNELRLPGRANFTYEGNCNDRYNFMRPVKILDCYFFVKDKDGNEFYLGEDNVEYKVKD